MHMIVSTYLIVEINKINMQNLWAYNNLKNDSVSVLNPFKC